jgi:hypothetical protein
MTRILPPSCHAKNSIIPNGPRFHHPGRPNRNRVPTARKVKATVRSEEKIFYPERTVASPFQRAAFFTTAESADRKLLKIIATRSR